MDGKEKSTHNKNLIRLPGQTAVAKVRTVFSAARYLRRVKFGLSSDLKPGGQTDSSKGAERKDPFEITRTMKAAVGKIK